MIAWARDVPMPGSLSSSAAEAELMSTRPPCCCVPAVVPVFPVVPGIVVERLVDVEGVVFCANAGMARSALSTAATRNRLALMTTSWRDRDETLEPPTNRKTTVRLRTPGATRMTTAHIFDGVGLALARAMAAQTA